MDESKRALWEEQFKDQASSGMTVESWCSEHQITRYTYYYWKKRIGKKIWKRWQKTHQRLCLRN